jgi:hypothetical protein
MALQLYKHNSTIKIMITIASVKITTVPLRSCNLTIKHFYKPLLLVAGGPAARPVSANLSVTTVTWNGGEQSGKREFIH